MNIKVDLLQKIFSSLTREHIAVGYEQITVDGTVKKLNVPTNAKYALITLESSVTGVAARYLETGSTTVSTTIGLGKGHLDSWDVAGKQNLINFQITQAVAGTHTLRVQYYI